MDAFAATVIQFLKFPYLRILQIKLERSYTKRKEDDLYAVDGGNDFHKQPMGYHRC